MHLTPIEDSVLNSLTYPQSSFCEFGSQARLGYYNERADARVVTRSKVIFVEYSSRREMFYDRLSERIHQFSHVQRYWGALPVTMAFIHPPLGVLASDDRIRSMMNIAHARLGSAVKFLPLTASLHQMNALVR